MTHPELIELAYALDTLDSDIDVEAKRRDSGNADVRDLDENLELLLELKEQASRLAAIVNEVERTAAKQIERRRYLGPTIKAEKFRSYADTWDVRRCAWDVIEPALVDEHGELRCDEQTAWALIDRLFGAAPVKYFRTGELVKLGLNPEEYRTREFRRFTVKVERITSEDGAA